MADWEFGYIVAELNSGRYFASEGSRIEVLTVADGPGSIRTMGGLRILPDAELTALDESSCAMLILPRGDSWLEPERAGAKGLAPVEFAHSAMSLLDAIDKPSLEAWLPLNTRRGADDYWSLQTAVSEARTHKDMAPMEAIMTINDSRGDSIGLWVPSPSGQTESAGDGLYDRLIGDWEFDNEYLREDGSGARSYMRA
jgi:hypothetical protein